MVQRDAKREAPNGCKEARHAPPLPDDVQPRRDLQPLPSISTADALPRNGFVLRPQSRRLGRTDQVSTPDAPRAFRSLDDQKAGSKDVSYPSP